MRPGGRDGRALQGPGAQRQGRRLELLAGSGRGTSGQVAAGSMGSSLTSRLSRLGVVAQEGSPWLGSPQSEQ